VAAGPGLPGAQAEAEAVAAIYQTAPLAGAGASVQAVMAALDGADVAHLAAHGHLHLHNPLFSSLQLADGPLTVYDLERLHRPPQLVVLAACDIGRPVVPAGDELLGLSAAFIAQGTRQIIASVTAIPDARATHLMIAFHRALAAGIPAAAALAQTQRRLAAEDAATMATAAAFVCIGGEYILAARSDLSVHQRGNELAAGISGLAWPAGVRGFLAGVAELLTGDDDAVAWADVQYVVFTLITLVYFAAGS
jgi:CHAT domain-containing protein